jgi:citrate lyase beta subunit
LRAVRRFPLRFIDHDLVSELRFHRPKQAEGGKICTNPQYLVFVGLTAVAACRSFGKCRILGVCQRTER